ncbi:MAG: Asp-tRNA(Asn)/Glu-tRNA(Gln) amidotransferase subunit GatC [Simkaniaceae bacterium]|nr:Asp-tRNA(Asn)/Glu-tRNA(Gln) amidotransferase subunit GatC [Simkaniaceae bacterium]
MSFTEKDLKKLKGLARIKCTEAEEVELLKKLQSTLDQIKMLGELDIGDVKPCCRVSETAKEFTREDEIHDVISREDLLQNAPDAVGGMIKVPSIMRENV